MSQYPYVGLRPFQHEETDMFFGREQHTDELLNHLSRQHFLAVIGMSGCGKSSLIKTGLISRLGAGFLRQAGTHWKITEMRPGNQPFSNLANALVKALGENYKIALLNNQFLKRDKFSLHELLAIQPLENNAKLLIVCDQFEEIFRYYQQGTKSEAAAFVSLLLASSKPFVLPDNTISHDIYVVLTMRSDFLGDCSLFLGLAEAINEGLYLTPRLNREQMRAAIEEPALMFDGEIEPELVVRLLEDAENNPDQLPLLQHILMRLWQLSENKILTLMNYQEIGCLDNALSNHADKIVNELIPEQQRIAEIMFCALTERGDAQRDTRRPMRLADIAELAGVDWQDVAEVVEVFRLPGRSFLMPPCEVVLQPESIIDISHESFIRQWQRLHYWIEREVENVRTYQRLEDRAIEWKQGKAGFLQSPELEIFLQWFRETKPNAIWARRYGMNFDVATIFLNASQEAYLQQQKYRVKRERVLILFLASLLILLAGLTGFSFMQYQKIEQLKNQQNCPNEVKQKSVTHK